MTDPDDLARAMRRELRRPLLAALALVVYGGTAVLLGLFWFTDLRPAVAPWMGEETVFVTVGFTLLVAHRARRSLAREHRLRRDTSPD